VPLLWADDERGNQDLVARRGFGPLTTNDETACAAEIILFFATDRREK
jgi:hypothetical protein